MLNLGVVKTVGVKIVKTGVKYAGPLAAGAMTVWSEIDAQKLRNTVKAQGETIKELGKKLSELEKR